MTQPYLAADFCVLASVHRVQRAEVRVRPGTRNPGCMGAYLGVVGTPGHPGPLYTGVSCHTRPPCTLPGPSLGPPYHPCQPDPPRHPCQPASPCIHHVSLQTCLRRLGDSGFTWSSGKCQFFCGPVPKPHENLSYLGEKNCHTEGCRDRFYPLIYPVWAGRIWQNWSKQ